MEGRPETTKSPLKRTGSGYLADAKLRYALERHSVTWALNHFETLGYLVDDVGGSNPYDILALSDEGELHIEVKGSSGVSTTVELTAGEVEEAIAKTAPYDSVLVVVDQINWSQPKDGSIATSGGRTVSGGTGCPLTID